MTAATYTSDLTDIFLFESTSNCGAWGGGGAAMTARVDLAMEGTNAVDKSVGATFGVTKGFGYENSSNFTIGSSDHFIVWVTCTTPGICHSDTIIIGDDTDRTDVMRFPCYYYEYGRSGSSGTSPPGEAGGEPFSVRFYVPPPGPDSPGLNASVTGSPSATPSCVGGELGISTTTKAPNLGIDGARIGTGYDVLGGTGTDDPANFLGIATDDESTSEGLFQTSPIGYLWQGKLRIGSSTAACEFEDSDTFVAGRKSNFCQPDFTEFLIENASTIVTLTNVTFRGLFLFHDGEGTPVYESGPWNLGRFEVITAAAEVNLTGCVFQDFGETVLSSNSTCLSCSWIATDTVTANGADLRGSLIRGYENTANTSPLIWDVSTDPDGLLDEMTITKGTESTHAIEFGTTSPLTMNLVDMDFSGYNTSNSQTDSTFHFKRTTGNITVYLDGCSGNFSYMSNGANVNLVVNPVTTLITVKDIETGSVIQGARVALEAADATGDLNFEESVTIVSSGTTATVTHTAHGLEDDAWVRIQGANEQEYNGLYEITTSNATTYTYTMTESGDSPATGTITSTTAIFNNTTNTAGQVTDTRTFTSNQNVVGRVRKSSSSPYYKTVPITATIDKDTGLTLTASMVQDE